MFNNNHAKSQPLICSLVVLMVALLTLSSTALAAGSISDPAPAKAEAQGQPSAKPVVPVVQPSDTIGEAADKQRLMRMLAEKQRMGGVSSPSEIAVPGIVLKSIPRSEDNSQKKGAAPINEPRMVLVEVMRGPTKLVAGIELNGVNRYVSVGEDVGNGWRVLGIDKYRVLLTSPEPASKDTETGSKSKGKGKTVAQKMRQISLPLGYPTLVAPNLAEASRSN